MDVEIDRSQTTPILPAALVVLAGGESRRMGKPKPLLPVAGTTLAEWLVGRLAPSFREVLVAAAAAEQVPPALRNVAVLDRVPGAGPLAGIEAGLGAATSEAVFAVACDVPNATAEVAADLLARLAGHDAAVPLVRGRPQPACAVYRRSALPAITAALDAGEYRAGALLDRLDAVYVERADAATFANLNSPEEYRAFLGALRHHG